VVVRFLIAVNAVVFLWEMVTGALSGPYALYTHGALVPIAVTQGHQYWRLITAAFLHANLMHILLNMLSLWWLGNFIENVAGSVRTAIIYAVSLLVSSLGVVYFSDPYTVTLGASGAIFGLFGALFAIGLKHGRPGMELIRANIGILVLNLIFTFAVPFISKAAHLAGLLAGFVLALIIYRPPVAVRAQVVDSETGEAIESTYEDPGAAAVPPFGTPR